MVVVALGCGVVALGAILLWPRSNGVEPGQVVVTPDPVITDTPRIPKEESEKDVAPQDQDKTPGKALKAAVIQKYAMQLTSWFQKGFSVSGMAGRPCSADVNPSALAEVSLAADRIVSDVGITKSSGDSAFDEAVLSALRKRVGQEVLAPPKDHPDVLESQVRLEFRSVEIQCRAGTWHPSED